MSEPSHAENARTLAESVGDATLATLEEDGHPYASVVLTAIWQGSPVLLISNLATHTQNLRRDARCSLLFREASPGRPLALGRMSIQGRAEPTDAGAARELFLQRHPDAAGYAGFPDFGFWRVVPERIRWIGGFGRMSWVDAEAWAQSRPDPLAPHAEGIVAHMNEDHVDALEAYVAAFGGLLEASDPRMTGIDRYGFEVSVQLGDGRRPVRIPFDEPISTPGEARRALVSMVKRAREKLAN